MSGGLQGSSSPVFTQKPFLFCSLIPLSAFGEAWRDVSLGRAFHSLSLAPQANPAALRVDRCTAMHGCWGSRRLQRANRGGDGYRIEGGGCHLLLGAMRFLPGWPGVGRTFAAWLTPGRRSRTRGGKGWGSEKRHQAERGSSPTGTYWACVCVCVLLRWYVGFNLFW